MLSHPVAHSGMIEGEGKGDAQKSDDAQAAPAFFIINHHHRHTAAAPQPTYTRYKYNAVA